MRQALLFTLLFLALVLTLQAAMSDAKAMAEAKKLFGLLAMIKTDRNSTDSNWYKEIGIESKGCATPMVRMGRGFNTWDAAFIDYNTHKFERPIAGPFSGTIQVKTSVYDNQALKDYQWLVDGNNYGALQNIAGPEPIKEWFMELTVDTTMFTDGIHVICGRATDVTGNVGLGYGIPFLIDQSRPSASTEWTPTLPGFDPAKPDMAPATANKIFMFNPIVGDFYVSPNAEILPTRFDVVVTYADGFREIQVVRYFRVDADKTGELIVGPDGKADWRLHVIALREQPVKVEIRADNGGIWEFPANPAGNWIVVGEYS